MVFAILPLLLTCGCSTFNHDWQNAVLQPTPAHSIEGPWVGEWSSAVSGHAGGLRCLISRQGEDRCVARYRATYAKMFRFSYTVNLQMHPHYGGWEFSGEENLGRLAGGVYFYEGCASPTNFFSTYRSKYDRGIFEMRRPQ